ncbi:STAS domain-containing protein [Planobispora takensis]|uniref:Anti-sigma factor antagonist n=1 Tax=Planobispora takensis TaxID=1367882 RepID=A0A8J3X0X7_9ACTN|nr:STAS domain-containing protein [Planobispora takensis]GII06187.1 hypothetical protein Pta02_81950 [Planobispora takensis]
MLPHPEPSLQTTTWQLDDLAVLRLAGELDALTAPLALSSAQQMLLGRAPVLVVDASQVSFIASAGIGALIRLRRQVEERAGRLVLVAPADGRVWRLLALMHLLEHFAVCPDLEAAVRVLRTPPPLPGRQAAPPSGTA